MICQFKSKSGFYISPNNFIKSLPISVAFSKYIFLSLLLGRKTAKNEIHKKQDLHFRKGATAIKKI
jgi:hypothetical protein